VTHECKGFLEEMEQGVVARAAKDKLRLPVAHLHHMCSFLQKCECKAWSHGQPRANYGYPWHTLHHMCSFLQKCECKAWARWHPTANDGFPWHAYHHMCSFLQRGEHQKSRWCASQGRENWVDFVKLKNEGFRVRMISMVGLTVAFMFGAAGCAKPAMPSLTGANMFHDLTQVRKGMSSNEVTRVMGTRYKTIYEEGLQGIDGGNYIWEYQEGRVYFNSQGVSKVVQFER
jgi:hypothetical protein